MQATFKRSKSSTRRHTKLRLCIVSLLYLSCKSGSIIHYIKRFRMDTMSDFALLNNKQLIIMIYPINLLLLLHVIACHRIDARLVYSPVINIMLLTHTCILVMRRLARGELGFHPSNRLGFPSPDRTQNILFEECFWIYSGVSLYIHKTSIRKGVIVDKYDIFCFVIPSILAIWYNKWGDAFLC